MPVICIIVVFITFFSCFPFVYRNILSSSDAVFRLKAQRVSLSSKILSRSSHRIKRKFCNYNSARINSCMSGYSQRFIFSKMYAAVAPITRTTFHIQISPQKTYICIKYTENAYLPSAAKNHFISSTFGSAGTIFFLR